jgi:hypothetical protein
MFSSEMIWEAVPQCRCSKSERFFTVPCGFNLWYFQNVVVSERIFRVFHMDKIMKTDRCKFERALRFIYEDYNSSYEELLQTAKVSSFQIRRMRTMALETYKIINKLAPVCLHDLVHMKNSKYSFRYNNILEIPQITFF